MWTQSNFRDELTELFVSISFKNVEWLFTEKPPSQTLEQTHSEDDLYSHLLEIDSETQIWFDALLPSTMENAI